MTGHSTVVMTVATKAKGRNDVVSEHTGVSLRVLDTSPSLGKCFS